MFRFLAQCKRKCVVSRVTIFSIELSVFIYLIFNLYCFYWAGGMVQLLKATLTSKNRFRIVKHLKIEEQKSKPNVRLHKSTVLSQQNKL